MAARVSKLEAEIANLKVMVATLVSLVRATPPSALGSGPQAPAPQDDLGPRVGTLETQGSALTNQLAQLSGQMTRLEAKLDAAPEAVPSTPQADLGPRLSKLETETGALADQLETIGEQMKGFEAKLDAAPKAAPAPQADLGPRLGKLETQTGALSDQLETIGEQMKSLEAKLDATPEAPQPPAPHAAKAEAPAPAQPPALAATPTPAPEPATQDADPRARWYGPKPGEDDGSPKSISPQDATGALPGGMPQSLAALPNENAERLYEQGYGDYLRQDYAGAEATFGKLVKRYPNDPLAGSAQYWIGETQYIRKQYQKAADTFLAGYRNYTSSDKAPDILLKLGMSLAALGEKDAACNSFKELNEKFPDAPGDLRRQAKGEAGKAGC